MAFTKEYYSDGRLIIDASFDVESNKIINLATPTLATDAATKAYVDGKIYDVDIKASSRVATTASLSLTSATSTTITKTGGLPTTLDGVTLASGDRILVKNESGAGSTGGSANGIYVYAAGTTWTRAADADADSEVTTGMLTYVSEGSAGGTKWWTLTTPDPIVVGTTQLTFTALPTLTVITYVDNERFVNGSGFTAGSSTSITLANTPTSGSQHVYLNGVRLSAGAGNDYTISGTTVSFLDKNGSARTFKANDVVLVDYRY